MSDGGAGFQSSLANLMSSTAGRRGIEAGQYATNWDQMSKTSSYQTWTDKFGTAFTGAVVDKFSNVKDFTSGNGTTSQLISSLSNSSDPSLVRLAASLDALKGAMGGRDVTMTVKKTDNGYTIEYDMAQLGKKGKDTITVGKDGNLIQAGIDTGKGLVMIDHGKVKIGGQDVTSLISDYRQQFQEKMAVNIGRHVAEKLGLTVSDDIAKIVGNVFMKSKSWDDFKQNLKDVINSHSHKEGKKHQKDEEEGKKHTETDKSGSTTAGGVQGEVGLGFDTKNGFIFGFGGELYGKYERYSGDEKRDDKYKGSSEKDSEYKDDSTGEENKNSKGSGYKEDTMKQLQHFVQDMEKKSKTLTKSFDDTKSETFQQAYEETKSASFAQQMAQRFGVELTPEALEKLENAAAYAEKTGDATAFIRAVGEISNDSHYWVGMDSSGLKKTKENIQNNINNVVGDVTKETSQVPKQTQGIEQSVPTIILWADQAASLDPKGPQVNLKDTIPEPKKPPEQTPTQSPQQSPQQQIQQPQQQNPSFNNLIGRASTPIQGQPTVKDIFTQAITNPSSGSAGNPFTPIGQMIPGKEGGRPAAPGANNAVRNNNNSKNNRENLR
jgi:DNA-binding ferritin-like protein (Dps family)